MRVLVWADGNGNDACVTNRLTWPARALKAQDCNIQIDTTGGPRVAWSKPWTGDRPPAEVDAVAVEKPDADVVVLQRPARKWWAQLIPMVLAHGVKVVVDIDDDFAHLPVANPAHRQFDPRTVAWANRDHIRAACHLADLVTVTTPALAARYGRHGRVRVLPNLIPASYLTIPHADSPTVGWTGSVVTHPDDLETTGRTVQPVLDRHENWTFHVVGTGHGVAQRLGLRTDPSATGWVPITDYPRAYSQLGVAIVPLHPGPFNEAKSALKTIEAAALGVPVIMSPTADNQRVHRAGVGLLAKRPHDWARQLDRLLGSPDLRAELSAAGRQVMADQTYERRADLWWAAWTAPVQALAA